MGVKYKKCAVCGDPKGKPFTVYGELRRDRSRRKYSTYMCDDCYERMLAVAEDLVWDNHLDLPLPQVQGVVAKALSLKTLVFGDEPMDY